MNSIKILGFLLIVLLPGFSFADGLDWMEGNWLGCDHGYLQEKAISSAADGVLVGANKIMQNGKVVYMDFVEVQLTSATASTLTFFSGTSVEQVAQCQMSTDKLMCQTQDGSFSLSATITRGATANADVLHMLRTTNGTPDQLDMTRADGSVPTCP